MKKKKDDYTIHLIVDGKRVPIDPPSDTVLDSRRIRAQSTFDEVAKPGIASFGSYGDLLLKDLAGFGSIGLAGLKEVWSFEDKLKESLDAVRPFQNALASSGILSAAQAVPSLSESLATAMPIRRDLIIEGAIESVRRQKELLGTSAFQSTMDEVRRYRSMNEPPISIRRPTYSVDAEAFPSASPPTAQDTIERILSDFSEAQNEVEFGFRIRLKFEFGGRQYIVNEKSFTVLKNGRVKVTGISEDGASSIIRTVGHHQLENHIAQEKVPDDNPFKDLPVQ